MSSPEEKPSIMYGPIDYAVPFAPATYRCGACGATQCKLWRDYQTFLEHQSLLCGSCALTEQQKDGPIDGDGKHPDADICGQLTDSIGWRVPAVPTEDGSTFWGYTSVPDAGVKWWRSMPTVSFPAIRTDRSK